MSVESKVLEAVSRFQLAAWDKDTNETTGIGCAEAVEAASKPAMPLPKRWSIKNKHDFLRRALYYSASLLLALGTRPFRLSPSTTFGYVATGAGPFVSFCYAREGATHSLMTEVSSFVTNKISSMFTGATSWFGLGGGGKEETGANLETSSVSF